MWRLFGSNFRSAALCLGPAAALVHVAPTAQCVKSKHAAAEHAKKEEARRNQYAEAMEYCNGDASKAYSASVQRVDDGEALRWPLISYRGLHDRLLGKVDNAQPFAHSAVLTVAEEADIVEACKDLNRHGQGIGRKELGKLVLESLELRPLVNRGRKYTPLSFNAKEMLQSAKVHQSWFVNFFANHPDISERQPCPEEIARAKWMTKGELSQAFRFSGWCTDQNWHPCRRQDRGSTACAEL